MDLYVNEKVTNKILKKLLEKISQAKPQINFPKNTKKSEFFSSFY